MDIELERKMQAPNPCRAFCPHHKMKPEPKKNIEVIISPSTLLKGRKGEVIARLANCDPRKSVTWTWLISSQRYFFTQ